MEAELNKIQLNPLTAIVSPGAIVLLFALWGIAILFPQQPNYFKDYEILCVFIFITFSFLVGTLINALAALVEKNIMFSAKHNPRFKAIENKHFWIEDLDELYFTNIGLHIYDIDKTTKQPKQGDVNGKKIDKYNFTQFEKFANFYLKKNGVDEIAETQKATYLFYRNLSLCFFICSFLSLAYLLLNFSVHAFSLHSKDIFFNTAFVIVLIAALIISGILLFIRAKKQRVFYLEDLYRFTRYTYLTGTKNN